MKKKLFIVLAVSGSIVLFIVLVFIDSNTLKNSGIGNTGDDPFTNVTPVNPTPTGTSAQKPTSTPLPHQYVFESHSLYEVYDRSFDSSTGEVEISVRNKKENITLDIQGKVALFGTVKPYFSVDGKYLFITSGTSITRHGVLISLSESKIIKNDFSIFGETKIFYKDFLIYNGVIKPPANSGEFYDASSVAYYNIQTGEETLVYPAASYKNFYMVKSVVDGIITVEHTYWKNPNDQKTSTTEILSLNLSSKIN